MGNISGVAVACVLVAACVQKATPGETFVRVTVDADEDAGRRAFIAMARMGLEPLIDPGAATAFGPAVPIHTGWRTDGLRRLRWIVYVDRGKLIIDSDCFETKPGDKPGEKGSKSIKPSIVGRCEMQETGMTQIARAILFFVENGR